VATPLLFRLDSLVSNLGRADEKKRGDDDIDENKVIIAGFGRFGQIVGRLLRARKIPFTALESNPAQVDFVSRFGSKIYYGDVSRLDLLRAAKADKAKLFVLAIEDVEDSIRTAEVVRQNFPHLTVFARARNRAHAYQLMDRGIDHIYRETFASSLETGFDVLRALGLSVEESRRTVSMFRHQDEERLRAYKQYGHDIDEMIELSKQWERELEELFEKDRVNSG